MRLGDKKRICIKSNRINHKKVSGFLLLFLFAVLCGTMTVYYLKIMQPILLVQAENQMKIMAEQAVQKSVGELFNDINYTDFIRLSRLEDGTISALESDMMQVNQLQAKASLVIQKALSEIEETKVKIPLGSITGYALLAGVGPKLTVEMIPYGRVKVDFNSKFTESGINQTRLEISLRARTNMGIVMPVGQAVSELSTEMPIIQTVIVGQIPDNYVNIDRMGEDYEGDVLDIIG